MMKFEIKIITEKLNIELPNDLDVLNIFDLGSLNVVLKKGDSSFSISSYNYKIPPFLIRDDSLTRELIIYTFRENDKLLLYWRNRMNSDLWNENEMFLDLAVLSKPSEHFIVLSLNKNSFGTIWKENPYDNFSRVMIAKNFTQFLGGLQFHLLSGLSEYYEPIHKKLYKNWGEDFWRIRDEEE